MRCTRRARRVWPRTGRTGHFSARSSIIWRTVWREPDQGLWEVRGDARHFTYSKVMAWVAFERGVRAVKRLGLEGPIERWEALCRQIHAEVCAKGFDAGKGSFVQSYGSRELDASLLMLPMVGFLPPDDPRVRGTIAAVERELLVDGFLLRYDTRAGTDGLPGREGAFLACTFWLVDAYVLMKRIDDARRLYERLLALRNDVGLLSEEYDPVAEAAGRQLPAGVLAHRAREQCPQPGGSPQARGAALGLSSRSAVRGSASTSSPPPGCRPRRDLPATSPRRGRVETRPRLRAARGAG